MAKFVWTSDKDILKNRKVEKKEELSGNCREAIQAGFKHIIQGDNYHISYDTEAQNNIQDVLRLFDNNMIEDYVLTVASGENYVRLNLTKQEFYDLHVESVKHRERNISKLRDILCIKVDEADTLEEVQSITWDIDIEETPVEPEIKDPKGLQDQIEGINQTFDKFLPEEGES